MVDILKAAGQTPEVMMSFANLVNYLSSVKKSL